jgi:hypothetical protein
MNEIVLLYKGFKKLKKSKWWKPLVACFILLWLGYMLFQFTLLTMLASVAGITSGDQDIKKFTIQETIPEDLIPHYKDAEKEYNTNWVLLLAIHYVQTGFARDNANGKYKDAFDLADSFWNSHKESKKRVECLKRCDNCNTPEAYHSCVSGCQQIQPDRTNIDDLIYTVASSLGSTDDQNEITLDRGLLPIVGTTEKVERTKLMWRYFVSILVTLGPPGGPDAAGQPLPPDVITTALRQAIAATNVDENTWLPAMQVLVMKESSGNPTEYNKEPVWYSRAWGYQHAEGLCQLMPPTFLDYKLAGHDDIWNPVDNTIASIRYILDKYKSISNIPGLFGGNYRGY